MHKYTVRFLSYNEISFLPVALGHYVLYILWNIVSFFLIGPPCQTWRWPYRKGPKHVVCLLTSTNKSVVFDLTTWYHWYSLLDKSNVCCTIFHGNMEWSRCITLYSQAQCQKGAVGNCHTPAALPLEQTQYAFYRKLGAGLDRCWKSRPHQGLNTEPSSS